MTIEVERVEVVGIDVTDLAGARDLLSELFGGTFGETLLGVESITEDVPLRVGAVDADPLTVRDTPTRIAIDGRGLFELVENAQCGMRNIHFKVRDIDSAIEQMQARGIRCVSNHRVRGMREAIFDSRDLFGLRLCFVQYDAPSLIEAMLGAG